MEDAKKWRSYYSEGKNGGVVPPVEKRKETFHKGEKAYLEIEFNPLEKTDNETSQEYLKQEVKVLGYGKRTLKLNDCLHIQGITPNKENTKLIITATMIYTFEI